MYMTQGEMEAVRREARETLGKLRSGIVIPNDDEEFCSLGLESGLCTKTELRQLSRQAVLREQQLQANQGHFCEELIAMSYMVYADNARESAYEQGMRNARDVQAML
jgi:hypothetical protein